MKIKTEDQNHEYNYDFLKKCRGVLERYITTEEKAVIISNMLGGNYTEVIKRMKDYFIETIDRGIEIHRERRDPKYAINIKVHSLPLTKDQKNFIYDNWDEAIDYFWGFYITPWIGSRTDDDRDAPIYARGRSGGWLVLGETPIMNYNNDLEEIYRTFKKVIHFKEEWDTLLDSMKRDLNKIIERGSVPDGLI